jgi:hypothetical protein
MLEKFKFGPNYPCPCLSEKKYKKCCSGKVDWEGLYKSADENPSNYMSARGKNLQFINKVAGILELDQLTGTPLSTIKKALRDKNKIRSIYECLLDIWPSEEDLNRILQKEKGHHSALFSGTYQPEKLFHGMCRHSLYADRILLVDPFLYPGSVRPEYDPLENPEQYANTTLNNLWIWFGLLPWIDAGIVSFIRSPDDFDLKLRWDSMVLSQEMLDKHNEIRECAKQDRADGFPEFKERFKESFTLNQPAEKLRKAAKELYPDLDTTKIGEVIAYFEKKEKLRPILLIP